MFAPRQRCKRKKQTAAEAKVVKKPQRREHRVLAGKNERNKPYGGKPEVPRVGFLLGIIRCKLLI